MRGESRRLLRGWCVEKCNSNCVFSLRRICLRGYQVQMQKCQKSALESGLKLFA